MTITLDLPTELAEKLTAIAEKSNIGLEDFLNQQIRAIADRNAAFESAASYVLSKNAELYRRLAK